MGKRLTLSHGALAIVASVMIVIVGTDVYNSVTRAATSAHPTTSAATAVTGTWIFKDAQTVEIVHLKVGRHGALTGSGSATKKSVTHRGLSGTFTLNVHDGHLRSNVLTFSLYIQEQFENYSTLVEYLRCTPALHMLHCKNHLQIAYKAYDTTQDFYRH